jgi:starch synthase
MAADILDNRAERFNICMDVVYQGNHDVSPASGRKPGCWVANGPGMRVLIGVPYYIIYAISSKPVKSERYFLGEFSAEGSIACFCRTDIEQPYFRRDTLPPMQNEPQSSIDGQPLNVLIVASEMYPFAKVGGLADVVASLAAALKRRGHDVRVVIPRYRVVDLVGAGAAVCLEPMGVWMGMHEEWCSVYGAGSPENVPVYLVEHQRFFDREGLYHDGAMQDYDDNPRRFGFLCRAALQLCKDLRFRPDVVHANDWQTALVSAYLKIWHWNDPLLAKTASLLTLHNVAYQGCYPKEHYDYLGLGWDNFTDEKFESWGRINLLKGGIHYCDKIVAVSPSFAREIREPGGGFGLAPFLAGRSGDLEGILNGIDYTIWDPAVDPKIPSCYSIGNLTGKKRCKRGLQEAFGLERKGSMPIIGAIGRFVEQKGFGLVTQVIERVLREMEAQFVVLGDGNRHLEEFFGTLPARFPGKAGSFIGFDDGLAHLVNAGCDFFLMPSQWEPCGLNQMYAQRYGTLPVVRAIGGLNDTVIQYDEKTGGGTGFKFAEFSPDALYYTIGWAVSTWYDRPAHMKRLIVAAMQQDFSWDASARRYEEAYRAAIENKKKYDSRYTKYYW